jgi:hypothetical protein
MANFETEKITSDNYRPGMLREGILVRYRPHPNFGWTGCRSFPDLAQAQAFTDTLTPQGDLPPEGNK